MNTYPLNEEQMFKDLRGLMQIKTINRNCGPMTDQSSGRPLWSLAPVW